MFRPTSRVNPIRTDGVGGGGGGRKVPALIPTFENVLAI